MADKKWFTGKALLMVQATSQAQAMIMLRDFVEAGRVDHQKRLGVEQSQGSGVFVLFDAEPAKPKERDLIVNVLHASAPATTGGMKV